MNSYHWFIRVSFLLITRVICSSPYPIGFSIPEEKFVETIPCKDQSFAHMVPGNQRTYIFETESQYYCDYQRSFFGETKKKGGWDW